MREKISGHTVAHDEPSSRIKARPERTPIRTYAELQTLDHGEIVEGYNDGWAGDAEPGDNRSKAYWHGWRNGYHDRFGGPPDPDSIALVRDMRRLRVGLFADGALGRQDGSPSVNGMNQKDDAR